MSSLMDKIKITSPFKHDNKSGAAASESTPLSAGGYISESATEDLQKANAYAVEKAKELSIQAREGDLSIRLLALLGGVAMCIVSAIGFVSNILHFRGVSAFIEVYTFCLGVVVILLEGTKMPFVKDSVRQNVSTYFAFVRFVWGRGILYFVAGTLELTQTGIADDIVGAYMCLIGIAYIIVGVKTTKKLKTLRKELLSPLQLRSKFNEADTDNTGTLTMGQFKALTDSMGVDMNRRQIDAAFMSMDKNANDVLSFEEFQEWWTNFDSEDAQPPSTTPDAV